MRKILLTTAMLALPGAAAAADLLARRAPPVYVPAAPPPPVFTWTGLYVGGQVGYDFGSVGARANIAGTPIGLASSSVGANGVIGGAHVGYNYQTHGIPFLGNAAAASFVFGVEGDVDGSSAKASNVLGGLAAYSSNTIQGSIRGRVGVAVDRVLFYATGGAAFANLDNGYVNTFNGVTDQFSHTRVGYTVGGGVEYAISNNWSIRAEYRHTDYGRTADLLVNTTNGGVRVHQRDLDNRAQIGFSYKFDFLSAPAPVVARY